MKVFSAFWKSKNVSKVNRTLMGMFFMKLALEVGKMSSISMVEDRICKLTSFMMFFKLLELISAPKHEELALLGPQGEVGL